MNIFLKSCLVILHVGQFLWTCVIALLYQPFVTNPLPLDFPRLKSPSGVSLILVTTTDDPADDEIEKALDSIVCAARCCMKAGIGYLSVYDKHGITGKFHSIIKLRLIGAREQRFQLDSSSGDSETESLAPEFSFDNAPWPECHGSLSSSLISLNIPGHALRRWKGDGRYKLGRKTFRSKAEKSWHSPSDLKLTLFSRDSSGPYMVSLARSFSSLQRPGEGEDPPSTKPYFTVEKLDRRMQDYFQSPSPELTIVYPLKQSGLTCSPLELHGYPPWLLRLTEIYYDNRPSLLRAWRSRGDNRVALSEEIFRRALDQYAQAEMRVGT